jgi:hypothetical protein
MVRAKPFFKGGKVADDKNGYSQQLSRKRTIE